MRTLLAFSPLLPVTAWADVAPGGGCRCAMGTDPSSLSLVVAQGMMVVLAGRRRGA